MLLLLRLLPPLPLLPLLPLPPSLGLRLQVAPAQQALLPSIAPATRFQPSLARLFLLLLLLPVLRLLLLLRLGPN